MLGRRIAAGVCFALISAIASSGECDSLEFFEREIRPILVTRCYECHGSESGSESANLRLDFRGGWIKGGDSGPAVDEHTPEASLLLRAISYEDPDLQMPPRQKLPQREIELLRAWIALGAPGPDEPPTTSTRKDSFDLHARRADHWAWQAVERPEVPRVEQSEWCRDDIDRFVLARLEAAGLAPADDADRATWLRRVTYDLTGLPPSVAEIEAFQRDNSPNAQEYVVDRLLSSQAFGEHWGQHWLDLVRYAESKGHEQDFAIPHAWRYRDYIIRAFNQNVPYKQLVVEHIAGDLISPPRIDLVSHTNQSIQGTGWWHLGEATHSPVDIRGEEADRIENQIDVFGKTFLGLTVACARCHEHKFDAISNEDYYALCGFIQSSSYQEANIADPEKQKRIAQQLVELNRTAGRQLFRLYADSTKSRLQQLLVDSEALNQNDFPPILAALESAAVDISQLSKDGIQVDFSPANMSADDWITSGYAFGERPAEIGTVIVRETADGPLLHIVEYACATNEITSPRLTGLYRTRTIAVAGNTLWYCFRGKADVFLDVDSHRTVAGPLHGVCSQKLSSPGKWKWFAHDVSDYIGHLVHVDFKPTGAFALAQVVCSDRQPAASASDAPLLNSDKAKATPYKKPIALGEVVDSLTHAIDAVAANRATAHDAAQVNCLLANDKLLPPAPEDAITMLTVAHKQYRDERKRLEAQLPEPQYALALLDGSGEDEHVHLRGNHKQLAPKASPRRFLSALGGEFPTCKGSGRLELAHRVADDDNPLTARVMVNRIWAHLMGQGIVPTVDNFGKLGQPPTHPELLNYLASEFVDGGWNIKRLIGRIVLSRTYRQASQPAAMVSKEDIDAADPANSLIYKARIRRLPAEAIRDALFVVSGELDRTPFGPSVPVHVTEFMRHDKTPKENGPMDGHRRRSIYIEVRRNAFNHFLAAFDKPTPFTTVGNRHQSNSAAQPLTLLNDPLVHHLMEKWAERLTTRFTSDQSAVQHAYLTAFTRLPSLREERQLLRFLDEHAQTGVTRCEAWQDLCLALVNSKEFLFLR